MANFHHLQCSVGDAKYENIFKSVVWRVDKLPRFNEGKFYIIHYNRLALGIPVELNHISMQSVLKFYDKNYVQLIILIGLETEISMELSL